MNQRASIQYGAVIAVFCLLSVAMSGCISQAGYEFKSGTTPPKEVSDLMKNGTVVLFVTQNNCPDCEKVKPKIADLQSQFTGTNVTFARFNIDDNKTSYNIAKTYGVAATPTTIVLRHDGAAAAFVSDFDVSTMKSAIEDARKS
ncbi:MAG: thioredoxin family protein [Halobacteriota archaeon]